MVLPTGPGRKGVRGRLITSISLSSNDVGLRW